MRLSRGEKSEPQGEHFDIRLKPRARPQRQSHHTVNTGEPCRSEMDGETPKSSAGATSSGSKALTAERSSSAGMVPTTIIVSVNGQQPSPGSNSEICA